MVDRLRRGKSAVPGARRTVQTRGGPLAAPGKSRMAGPSKPSRTRPGPRSKPSRAPRKRARYDYSVDAAGRIHDARGRYVSARDAAVAAVRGGIAWRDVAGRVHRIRRRTPRTEEGELFRRVPADSTARILGAEQYRYTAPDVTAVAYEFEARAYADVSARLQAVSTARPEDRRLVQILVRLVDSTGAVMYRAASSVFPAYAAWSQASLTVDGWMHRYAASRIIAIHAIYPRAPMLPASPAKRLRAKERRAWRAGTRTTRGR